MAQLAHVLLKGGKGYLIVLAQYLDASGMTDGNWAVLAGFVAPVEKWIEFERDWADLLKEKKYAGRFSLRDGKVYAHARKMRQWPKALREQFYFEANYLLKRTVSFATGIAIKRSDYRKAYKGYPLTQKDSLYGLAYRASVIAACKNIAEHYQGESIATILESGDINQGSADVILAAIKQRNKKLAGTDRLQYPVLTNTVANKEDWGALQVADMHAYGLLKHMESSLHRRIGKGSKQAYFGDINILLSEINHSHLRLEEQHIRKQRAINIQNYQARKAYGKRRQAKS
jgi:hypothetical protein